MSIGIMANVWKHAEHEGGTLLILLALADYANQDGIAWPSIKNLASKARLSERQTQSILRDLEKAGEIKIEYETGRSNTNRYTLVGYSDDGKPTERVKSAAEKGAVCDTQKGAVCDTKGEVGCTRSVTTTSVETEPSSAQSAEVGQPVQERVPTTGVLPKRSHQIPDPQPAERWEPNSYERNAMIRDLAQEFTTISGVEAPICRTQGQFSKRRTMWDSALREIGELHGWDTKAAADTMRDASNSLRSKQLTVSSPRSLLNNCRDLVGQMRKRSSEPAHIDAHVSDEEAAAWVKRHMTVS